MVRFRTALASAAVTSVALTIAVVSMLIATQRYVLAAGVSLWILSVGAVAANLDGYWNASRVLKEVGSGRPRP